MSTAPLSSRLFRFLAVVASAAFIELMLGTGSHAYTATRDDAPLPGVLPGFKAPRNFVFALGSSFHQGLALSETQAYAKRGARLPETMSQATLICFSF
jgi:hypothetical protein